MWDVMGMLFKLVMVLSPNVAGAVGRAFAESSGAGGSAGAGAGSSGANVTVPAWDAPFEHQGYQCTDASLDHAPYQENNTRWSFWSVPAGEPPSGGWPIYVEFLAESMHPDVFAHNASLSCGNGWMPTGGGGYGPPTPASCTALLNQRCPVAKFRPDGQKGEGECQACIHEIGTMRTKLARRLLAIRAVPVVRLRAARVPDELCPVPDSEGIPLQLLPSGRQLELGRPLARRQGRRRLHLQPVRRRAVEQPLSPVSQRQRDRGDHPQPVCG